MLQINGKPGPIYTEKRKTGLHPVPRALDIRIDRRPELALSGIEGPSFDRSDV